MAYLPTEPEQIPCPFAENGDRNHISPAPTQQGMPNATWKEGFPSITMMPKTVGGLPPLGRDFNGVFWAISACAVWHQHGGVYAWTADRNYRIGCHVLGADKHEYIALKDTGPDFSSSPAVDPTTAKAKGVWVDITKVVQSPGFESGTKAFFQQSAAPTGWTKITSYNDYALRLVSGNVGVRSNAAGFSAVFTNAKKVTVTNSKASVSIVGTRAGISVNGASLSWAQNGQHSHLDGAEGTTYNASWYRDYQIQWTHKPSIRGYEGRDRRTGADGNGSAHGHGVNVSSHGHGVTDNGHGHSASVDLAVNYLDVILCERKAD